MISSAMAAIGGIILAANVNSVDLNFGGGTLLLNSIAAAVIGGTSLFGGRGEVWSAFLGAAVIATVSNGLNTAGYSSGTIYIVTGVILLLAVTLDTIGRRLQVKSAASAPLGVTLEDLVGRDVCASGDLAVRPADDQLLRPSSPCRGRSGRAGPPTRGSCCPPRSGGRAGCRRGAPRSRPRRARTLRGSPRASGPDAPVLCSRTSLPPIELTAMSTRPSLS